VIEQRFSRIEVGIVGFAKSARMWGTVAILAAVGASLAGAGDKPTESVHTKGPHGLEGWTLESPVPESSYGDERFGFTLVLARDGQILRRIKGDPIVWRWMFWEDGKQVAYETESFHFSMACVLADVETGRELGRVDCYHELPADAPDWVKALEGKK
jgi:hypothetical protein